MAKATLAGRVLKKFVLPIEISDFICDKKLCYEGVLCSVQLSGFFPGHLTAVRKVPVMPNQPASNHLPTQQPQKPACAVCWEDFDELLELDNHIRASHPDRISAQEELFARREVA